MRTVAIIPGYNEGRRITDTVRAVRPHVDEILVIDDGSIDDTAEQAREAGAIVARHCVNRGQGAALRTGMEGALALGADILVQLDADGQHDPSFIPQMVAPILSGKADVTFGSRFMGVEAEGITRGRRLLLHGARTFNAFAVGVPTHLTDPQSGYRAFSAAAARHIDFKQDRMAHCSEILRIVTRSKDLRWCEVPVRVRYTRDSMRKGQKPWDAARIAWQLFVGAFTK
ncbi:MAG: glycosyltransferase family 2 protein [Myxococcales bacterium]|nr:glycosyltransferase family 2 protein [Myxococcales bacterium]